jgi:predicted O-methyltransferase YrrM
MIVSLVAAALVVAGGFADFATAADNDGSIKVTLAKLQVDLRAALTMVAHLTQEKTTLTKSLDAAREKARELKKDYSEASIQIRRVDTMTKHYAILIKDLRAENRKLQNELAKMRGGGAQAPVKISRRPSAGRVTAVHEGVASINVGRANGVKEKMVLKIFRDGKFIANLRVDLLKPSSAAGVILDKKHEVKQGDVVGESPEKTDKPPRRNRGRMGFNFGGKPKVDSPPVPRGEKEKQALAALNEMTKGKWYLNITTREGRVLRQLVESTGAKRIVEIGTSSGYSTIWLAMGARATGGKVFTHEINPKMIEIARANFKKAGVDDIITIIKGDAHDTIKQHKDTIDVVFLDAEKKGYLDYLTKLLPLVRPGGLILGHDMHPPMPDPRYIKAITTNPDLDTSFMMMESFGFSMTVKKR